MAPSLFLGKIEKGMKEAERAGLSRDERLVKYQYNIDMCDIALSMVTTATPRDDVYQLHAYTSRSYFESFRINLAGTTVLDDEMAVTLKTQLEEALNHFHLSNASPSFFPTLLPTLAKLLTQIKYLRPYGSPLQVSLSLFLSQILESTLRSSTTFLSIRRDAHLAHAELAHFAASRLVDDHSKINEASSIVSSVESVVSLALDLEERLQLEARKSGDRASLLDEDGDEVHPAEDLSEDFRILSRAIEGVRKVRDGDGHRAKAYETKVELSVEQIQDLVLAVKVEKLKDLVQGWGYLALDAYNEARRAASGADLETEAQALGKAGILLQTILDQQEEGHKLNVLAVQLRNTISSLLPNEPWYRECLVAIETHRTKLEREESLAWEAARRPLIQKLKPELDELSVKAKEVEQDRTAAKVYSFLRWVIERFPPKEDGAVCPELGESRTMLTKAAGYYHRDKNKVGFEAEWFVLTEEIVKQINGLAAC